MVSTNGFEPFSKSSNLFKSSMRVLSNWLAPQTVNLLSLRPWGFESLCSHKNKIMNKCQNCGKEVKNKYCNVSCQNIHRGKLNIEKYNEIIRVCKGCGEALDYSKRKNKYCSEKCSIIVNNKKGLLRKTVISKLKDYEIIDIFNKSSTYKELYTNLGYSETPASKSLKIIKDRLKDLGLNIENLKRNKVSLKTKGDLFKERLNWQSARSSIAKDCRIVFKNSDKPKCCYICGYSNHIEIAHIKSVSSFDDDVLVSEINHINNLLPLCPNHHWEFDNGLLKL